MDLTSAFWILTSAIEKRGLQLAAGSFLPETPGGVRESAT
jgi:hypothetical protein